MKKQFLRDLVPHAVAIIVFFLISLLYFNPMLEGKQLGQSDIRQYEGMAREKKQYEKETDKPVLWTNSMFGGMPTYLIGTPKSPEIFLQTNRIFNLYGKMRPLSFLFLYLLGFYIALIIFRVNPWISIIGAVAFAFSSYFFIILEAGHTSKAIAIGYMPPVIAGVYLAFRKKIVLGCAITGLFLTLQLLINHLQITYYTLLMILVLGIFELIRAIGEKQIKQFILSGSALLLVAILAVGTNLTILWTTYEYGKHSIRGKSELTGDQDQTSGLDKSYATQWSYGIDETFTLLIPNFKGGSSTGSLTEKSETYKLFRDARGPAYAKQIIKALPLYWGTQPFTGGPVYVGAVVLFFFVFGLFAYHGKLKWWLVTITILSILLAWGKNFMVLTDLFLDYFPGYNKFRTVTMILVIAEFAIPLLAFLALQDFFAGKIKKEDFMKGLKYGLISLGGLALIFALFPGMFSYTGPGDDPYLSQGSSAFIDALIADRKRMLQTDAVRSLIFILLSATLLYLCYRRKIEKKIFFPALAILILVDMWTVDKRYLNNDDFVPGRQAQVPFQPLEADLIIQQDTSLHYRVFDLTANPFLSARASYFHNSLGGYHGAKMERYQELIDYHLTKNNMAVINMLNTKYFIIPSGQGPPEVQMNPNALGNAWFVKTYRIVDNADEEIQALSNFDPANEAIIDARYNQYLEGFNQVYDSAAYIRLTQYHPDRLLYEYQAGTDQLAVFSEIYYDKGWSAYIDGKLHPHFRANYILRAMVLPAGHHIVEYKFEPKSYYTGKKIAGITSVGLLLLILLGFGFEIRNYVKTSIKTDQT
jgi:hypothetical protein